MLGYIPLIPVIACVPGLKPKCAVCYVLGEKKYRKIIMKILGYSRIFFQFSNALMNIYKSSIIYYLLTKAQQVMLILYITLGAFVVGGGLILMANYTAPRGRSKYF
ncbi:MAG: hypothetical protein R2828_08280 [Saprospiraceae bacterium]